MAYELSVRREGPVFDGEAERILERACVNVRHELAQQGAWLTRGMFNASIRVNRQRFVGSIHTITESQVFATPSGRKTYTMPIDVPQGSEVVTSSIASYGPWLEGTGSRNETTRFKGYWGFRRASQELDRQSEQITDRVLEGYVEMINE